MKPKSARTEQMLPAHAPLLVGTSYRTLGTAAGACGEVPARFSGWTSDNADGAELDDRRSTSSSHSLVRRDVALLLSLLALLVLAGCAAQPEAERYREQALQAAYEIGQVQMSCPEATPTITSSQTAQPPPNDAQTNQAAQFIYTANVAGCGENREYLIVCREDGNGCTPTAR